MILFACMIIAYGDCLSVVVPVHFAHNKLHQILDAVVRIVLVRLLYHAVAQQQQDLVLGNESVAIHVVHAERKLDRFGQRAAQEHGQPQNEGFAAQRLHVVVPFPGDEDAVHQRLVDDQIEGAVHQLAEAVAIDALYIKYIYTYI